MKAIIIDDEMHCIESLKAKIDLFIPDLNVIKTFVLPQEALKELPKFDVEVLFLDIEMPHINGISFAEKANLSNTELIFTTAHQKYAIDAFRVSAFDFLLKPIDRHNLRNTIDRLHQKLAEKGNTKISKLNARYNKITVSTAKGMHFIAIDTILYLEADSNYTTIYLLNGTKILTSRTIGSYEDTLLEYDFCRIHQTYLVNIQHITEYLKGEGGHVIMINGIELEVSRRRKIDLMTLIS